MARASPAAADAGAPDPHAVQPERPTVATHAHTVAPGWVELESGLERDRFPDATRGLTATLVAKIGLAPRAQLNLTPTWQRVSTGDLTGSGAGDLTVGLKWRPVDGAPL